MTDYHGNSKKERSGERPERKPVEKITTGEVLIQKPSVGQKFKSLFVAESFRTVKNHVIFDVFIPALRDMMFDGLSQGARRMMYGERAVQRGYRASHVTYNSPVQRGYSSMAGRDNLDRSGLTPGRLGAPPVSASRQSINTGIVLSTKDEADGVLEHMTDILDKYGSVTVGDLYHMVGLSATHVDEAWGWSDLRNAQVNQIREGYLLDLPQPQPLQ